MLVSSFRYCAQILFIEILNLKFNILFVSDSESYVAYVANLKKNLKKEDLENVFENVKNIRMIKDRESGKFRGFAFVEFENKNSFDEALQVNHALFIF